MNVSLDCSVQCDAEILFADLDGTVVMMDPHKGVLQRVPPNRNCKPGGLPSPHVAASRVSSHPRPRRSRPATRRDRVRWVTDRDSPRQLRTSGADRGASPDPHPLLRDGHGRC